MDASWKGKNNTPEGGFHHRIPPAAPSSCDATYSVAAPATNQFQLLCVNLEPNACPAFSPRISLTRAGAPLHDLGQHHIYNNTRKFQRKPHQEIQDKFFLWVQDMFLIMDNIGIYLYMCIDAGFLPHFGTPFGFEH